MGMFDSFYIPYKRGVTEVQTKQLGESMDSWNLGETVIEGDFGTKLLTEDFNPSRSYGNPLRERFFTAIIVDGVFCDYAIGHDADESVIAAERLLSIWSRNSWRSRGMAILLRAAEGRAKFHNARHSALYSLSHDWLYHLKEEELTAADPSRKARLTGLGSLFALRGGVDFSTTPFQTALRETMDAFSAQNPRQASFFIPSQWTGEIDGDDDSVFGRRGERPVQIRAYPWNGKWKNAEQAVAKLASSGHLVEAARVIAAKGFENMGKKGLSPFFDAVETCLLGRTFLSDAIQACEISGWFPETVNLGAKSIGSYDMLFGRTCVGADELAGVMAAHPVPDQSITHLLLSGEVDSMTKALSGRNPDSVCPELLFNAASVCDKEAVDLLLAAGADPNLCVNGSTPMENSVKEAVEKNTRSSRIHSNGPDDISREESIVIALASAGGSIDNESLTSDCGFSTAFQAGMAQIRAKIIEGSLPSQQKGRARKKTKSNPSV